jgi:hypothetical protein
MPAGCHICFAMTWIFKCCGLFYAQQFEVRGFVLFILVELLTIAVETFFS